MVAIIQRTLFDYGSFDADTTNYLKQNAQETRGLLLRTSEDIIQIGKNILEAKKRLKRRGEFISWVRAELGISQPTAWRFMQVAQGKSIKSFNMNELVVLPPVERIEGDNGLVKLRGPKDVVKQFFADFPHLHALSNVEIAKRTGTTEGTVRKIKKELFPKPAAAPKSELAPEPEPDELKQEQTQTEPDEVTELVQETPSEPEPAKLPKIEASQEVQLERDIRRQEQQERNEELKEKGVELPKDTYACLVVDPPWPMQKIEREERPNQFGFDYPTMTEQELRDFQLPKLTADDCHLYLWATQKHLPLAFDLAKHWGFKYQCLMTWVKNVGFTPFAWMYSTEHVLFCTKGSLPLLEVGKRLDFSAKVREHSRKPDEFYELVREVSPGPRLDVFSREKRDGFEQYGNEVEKYV